MTIVFFLEEPSIREFLQEFLSRRNPGVDFKFVVFEGKSDLERGVGRKLRVWRAPDTHFFVLRDQDSGDCRSIKSALNEICEEANRENVNIVIVCREVEGWYLGDIRSVESVFDNVQLSKRHKRSLRNPDDIVNAKQILREVTHNSYQPISGSREIGKVFNEDRCISQSFRYLANKVDEILA